MVDELTDDLTDKENGKYYLVSIIHTKFGNFESENVFTSTSKEDIDLFMKKVKLKNPNVTLIKTHLKEEDFDLVRKFCKNGNLDVVIQILHDNDKNDFLAKFPFRQGWIFEHVINRILHEKNILKKIKDYLEVKEF